MANEQVRCPECGSTVTVDDKATQDVPTWTPPMGEIVIKTRTVVVAFCDGCDWAHEIWPEFLRRAA